MSSVPASATARTAPLATALDTRVALKGLSNVLVVAAMFCGVVAVAVLGPLDGWSYYRTPLAVRGYHPAHPVLRPSGTIGLLLGVSGMFAMLATLPYAVRKRSRRLARLGPVSRWLEVHIFFGIVGPVLITFHTSFKFNGLISAGYWLMLAVWASGFVGRYLYVRIPKTMRGTELSAAQVEEQLARVRAQLAATPLPDTARRELELFETMVGPPAGGVPGLLDLFIGELRARVRLSVAARQLKSHGVDVAALGAAVSLAVERAVLARRLAHLARTRRLFDLWHVFHRPLVSALFVIVAIHVGIALYLGYVLVP